MRIAVVGGGFAGLFTAARMLSLGFEVDLYEEHVKVGYPPHCTGVVSWETVEGIGQPARDSLEAVYKGLIVDIDGVECKIETRDRIAKLDRVKLEEHLLAQVAGKGTVRLGTRVRRLTPKGALEADGDGERRYDVIILAEGVHGGLRRQIGLHHRPTTSLGVNIEVPNPSSHGGEYFRVGFQQSMSGYTWEVPVESRLVVGALSTKPGEAVRRAEKLAGEAKRLRIYGGRVIHGPPLPTARRGRVIVLGDAAGVNKPVSGGGLWPNTMLVNQWASLVEDGLGVFEAFDTAYKAMYRRLRKQYKLARALYEAPPGERARFLRFLSQALAKGLCERISGRIGYDSHEKLVGIALRDPLFLAKMAPDIIRNINVLKKIIL